MPGWELRMQAGEDLFKAWGEDNVWNSNSVEWELNDKMGNTGSNWGL